MRIKIPTMLNTGLRYIPVQLSQLTDVLQKGYIDPEQVEGGFNGVFLYRTSNEAYGQLDNGVGAIFEIDLSLLADKLRPVQTLGKQIMPNVIVPAEFAITAHKDDFTLYYFATAGFFYDERKSLADAKLFTMLCSRRMMRIVPHLYAHRTSFAFADKTKAYDLESYIEEVREMKSIPHERPTERCK